MKLTFIRKSALSDDSNCPARYGTNRGTYVVVGRIVNDTHALGQIPHLRGDDVAVEVPADVVGRQADGS